MPNFVGFGWLTTDIVSVRVGIVLRKSRTYGSIYIGVVFTDQVHIYDIMFYGSVIEHAEK